MPSIKNIFQRPVTIKPVQNGAKVNAKSRTPFFYGKGQTIVGDEAIASPVFALFLLCCPSAVARFVVSVVVYTIKRMIERWTFAHIREKIIKGIPSLANGYSSTAIVFPRTKARVATARPHSNPSAMLRALRFLMGRFVSQSDFTLLATTRKRVAATKCGLLNGAFGSANTNAKIHPSSFNCMDFFYYFPIAKSLTRNIKENLSGLAYPICIITRATAKNRRGIFDCGRVPTERGITKRAFAVSIYIRHFNSYTVDLLDPFELFPQFGGSLAL